MIKTKYVSMTAEGRKLAGRHLAYLERDGVERDGSPGRLYGADEKFDAEEFRGRLPEEKRQFRFIVSPQDGARADLTELARQLMRQVEKDSGRRLLWAAVNHHDTDNPHVHIVVRGLDRDGDEFRIDRQYLAHGMRWRAQEILTRELGRRSERDVSEGWAVDVSRDGFTEIDRAISERCSNDNTVSLATLLRAPEGERLACLDRLQVLEEMQLATREASGAWRLADGWKAFLVQRGEDVEARSRLQPLVGEDASRYEVLRAGNPVPVVDGVVVGMGLHDELSGEMFAAIKTSTGRGYYLRLPPQLAETLQEKEAVRIGFEAEPWLKPADRIVARFAQENGGIYDPVRHQGALERLRRPDAGDGQPTPAERVAANVRRLERLARYRLVTRLADGRWQVPPDLLSQLESRERTHPQHRFRFEKLGGPTREPVRPRATDVALEKDALGRTLSKKSGFAYADPRAFRGRVVPCPATASGREYVQIVRLRHGAIHFDGEAGGSGAPRGTNGAPHARSRGAAVAPDRTRIFSIANHHQGGPMESTRRKVGRPKSAPRTGPLVLGEEQARATVTLEISNRAAEELAEYTCWVEKWSGISANEARFKTIDFALREIFRRDRIWQAERRAPAERGRRASTVAPTSTPPMAVPSPSLPPPSPRAGAEGGRS